MSDVTCQLEDQAVIEAFQRFLRFSLNPKPALKEMGKYQVRSTEHNFASGSSPDGVAWPALAFITLVESYYDTKGRIFRPGRGKPKKAKNRVDYMKRRIPLTKTGEMRDSIEFRLGKFFVDTGSDNPYLKFHQKEWFEHPDDGIAPKIPKRQPLGFSDIDLNNLTGILVKHMAMPFNGNAF